MRSEPVRDFFYYPTKERESETESVESNTDGDLESDLQNEEHDEMQTEVDYRDDELDRKHRTTNMSSIRLTSFP